MMFEYQIILNDYDKILTNYFTKENGMFAENWPWLSIGSHGHIERRIVLRRNDFQNLWSIDGLKGFHTYLMVFIHHSGNKERCYTFDSHIANIYPDKEGLLEYVLHIQDISSTVLYKQLFTDEDNRISKMQYKIGL